MPWMKNMLSYSHVFGAAVAFIAYKVFKRFSVPKELKHVPAISLFKTFLSLGKGEPFDVRVETTIKPVLEKQGVARLWNQGNWELMVSDHRYVKEILARVDKYPKMEPGGKPLEKMLLRETLGYTNILHSDGSDWRRHRRIANPAFKNSWPPEMFSQCTTNLVNLIEASLGKPQQVQDLFNRLTLDVLGKGLLGYDFEAIVKGHKNPILKLYTEVMAAMTHPLYFTFPVLEDWVPSRKASHKKAREFRDFLKSVINERKTNLDVDHNDLLTLMIKASIEEKDGQYTVEDVVNDLAVFFLAGHDTTANTLTTVFYYLAKHPEIQEKARKEINALLNDEKRTPTITELKEMPYTDCIIKESMRIVSTVPRTRRYCVEDNELSGGLVIPKNTFIHVHFWNHHHNEHTYPDPYSFDPDRFKDLRNEQNAQFMGFGSGSRMCIGKNFSLLEQRVVLTMLLQRFTVHLGPQAQKEGGPKVSTSGLMHLVGVDLVFKPIA